MSKFLKIIVNLVVIAAIAVAAALLVPPFAGIDTVMNDNTETDTNLPVGSVAYGRTADTSGLKVGDRIIYSEGASDYIYEITDMDASAGVYKVSDPYNSNSEAQNITIQKSIPKVVLVVPFIGYGAIALQSTEGLIVVGLGIVFLIILFILSEIWRNDRDEEEEDEESEEDMQNEEEDDEDEEEDEVLSRRERRRLKKEEKRRRKMAKREAMEEDEDEEAQEELPESQDPEEDISKEGELTGESLDKAVEEAMSSVAAGVSQISEPEQVPDATIVMPDISTIGQGEVPDESQEIPEENSPEDSEETEAEQIPEETELSEPIAEEEQEGETEEAAETQEVIKTEEPQESVEAEEKEKAFDPESVPNAPSLEELLAKAQAAGDAPEVKEDKDNQVTLLDYSDIL